MASTRRLDGSTMRNVEDFYWRTDLKMGRNIYALLSNDPAVPSTTDPVIGTMESSELAELIVETHNRLIALYGPPKRYRKVLGMDG